MLLKGAVDLDDHMVLSLFPACVLLSVCEINLLYLTRTLSFKQSLNCNRSWISILNPSKTSFSATIRCQQLFLLLSVTMPVTCNWTNVNLKSKHKRSFFWCYFSEKKGLIQSYQYSRDAYPAAHCC